jgi:hypothetical protein
MQVSDGAMSPIDAGHSSTRHVSATEVGAAKAAELFREVCMVGMR